MVYITINLLCYFVSFLPARKHTRGSSSRTIGNRVHWKASIQATAPNVSTVKMTYCEMYTHRVARRPWASWRDLTSETTQADTATCCSCS